MRPFEDEIRQIGNEVRRSNPHTTLESFDVGEPRQTRRTPLQMGASRGDLDSRRFPIEFGRQRLARRSARHAHGTKVPKVLRHAE